MTMTVEEWHSIQLLVSCVNPDIGSAAGAEIQCQLTLLPDSATLNCNMATKYL
jgi:hypothetical protein